MNKPLKTKLKRAATLSAMALASTLSIGSLSGCVTSVDLAKTLRYSNNTPVAVDDIQFKQLTEMKRGNACTWNFLYIFPIYGDGSIITAADEGEINSVELIGQTGKWYFPMTKNCTVVFGDKPVASKSANPPTLPDADS